MTISPFLTVLLAVPVLLGGEWLVRRVPWLGRTNIPAPVVGGLVIAALVLALRLGAQAAVAFTANVTAGWWTWLVTIEPEWAARPARAFTLPILVSFYVCVGLNSTWAVVRRGSLQVVIFLAVATLLGLVQNIVGVALALAMGLHPLMGILCGSVTMTGGHGTVGGFEPMLKAGGLTHVAEIGYAMATIGIVIGSLMGGPLGGWLIRRRHLKTEIAPPAPASASAPTNPASSAVPSSITGTAAAPAPAAARSPAPSGLWHDLRLLGATGLAVLRHVLLVLAVVKGGAWATYFLLKTGVTFPIHIGAMLLGTAVRNLLDLAAPGWIRSEIITPLGSVLLALFLTITMMGLNLADLVNTALPMLVILAVQVLVMTLFAIFITFRAMGRDYEAAQMAAGHCGFGIGNTANAVATMQTLVEKYGPAPRAFLVVPLVGGMLGDLTNAVNVTESVRLLKWLFP